MAKSDKKYADPTGVLRSITDGQGRPVDIGDERDIGEFNDIFLSRLQEGLHYKTIYEEAKKTWVEQQAAEEAALAVQDQQNSQPGGQKSLVHKDSSILVDDVSAAIQNLEREMNINEEGKANDIEMTNEEKKPANVFDEDIISQNFKGRVR